MKKVILSLLLALCCSTAFAQRVSFVMSACSPGTRTELTTVNVGQTFDLVFAVQDLRPNGTWIDSSGVSHPLVRGVFAAYTDVLYDKTIARVTGYSPANPSSFVAKFTFSKDYQNGIQAYDAVDRINDAGSFAGAFNGLALGGNTEQVEVWRVNMTAVKAGSLIFRPDVTNLVHPQCDTLVYGNDGANPPEPSYVPAANVVIVTAPLTVNP